MGALSVMMLMAAMEFSCCKSAKKDSMGVDGLRSGACVDLRLKNFILFCGLVGYRVDFSN